LEPYVFYSSRNLADGINLLALLFIKDLSSCDEMGFQISNYERCNLPNPISLTLAKILRRVGTPQHARKVSEVNTNNSLWPFQLGFMARHVFCAVQLQVRGMISAEREDFLGSRSPSGLV
jgi:hypothetical protein